MPSDIPLESLSASGDPPKTRVKDAKAAHAIYVAFSDADRTPAMNRAMVHALLKGEPPFDQQVMIDAGMGEFTNVNWGEASADLEQAQTQYINLTDLVPTLIRVKTAYGPVSMRPAWEAIIASEFTSLMRERWGAFYKNKQKTARWFVGDGLGVNYFPHDVDWRFKVGRLGEFLFSPDADVDEDSLDVVCQVEDFTPPDLYRLLKADEKVTAKGDKSHVDRNAILAAVKDVGTNGGLKVSDYDAISRAFEGNDLSEQYGGTKKIKLVHVFVKEFSGKVSHYLVRADGKAKDFLYQKQEAFSSMGELIVFYNDGVGEGDIGSLQGQIQKAFSIYQAKNQLYCRRLDWTNLSLSIPIKAGPTATAQEALAQLVIGPLMGMPRDVEFVSMPVVGSVGNQADSMLAEMSRLGANNTGGYQAHDVSPEGGSRTAREVTLQAANSAQLSSAKLTNWYQSESKLYWNVFRRLKSKAYTSKDPGWEERMEWLDRIKAKGVPLEAVWQVEKVTAVRSIGYGSFQAQQAAFQVLESKRGAMDPVSQRNLDRDSAAAVVGYDNVDAYLPPLNLQKTPEATRDAGFENIGFVSGIPMPVYPDDEHYEHLPVHNAFINGTFQMLESGAIDERQVVKQLGPALQHQQQHLQDCTDPARKDVVKQYGKSFSAAAKQFTGLAQKVQQESAQSAPAANQVPPETALKAHETGAQLALDQSKAQAEQQRLDWEAQQRQARENAKTQAQVAGHVARTRAAIAPKTVRVPVPMPVPVPVDATLPV